MPTLLLNRQCRIVDPESAATAVVCESRPNVSAGTCTRITPDPAAPTASGAAMTSRALPATGTAAPSSLAGLPPGRYVAHSTLTPNCAQSVYFEVGDPAGSRSSAAGATRTW